MTNDWNSALDSAHAVYESYVQSTIGKIETEAQRKKALNDALQHAIGIIRLNNSPMTEAHIIALTERLHNMTESDRRALDPICKAVQQCWSREPMVGGKVIPNRIVALACLDLAKAYSETVFKRP